MACTEMLLLQDLPREIWPDLIFLEDVAAVYQRLKAGTFIWATKRAGNTSGLTRDFADGILGWNQAPIGGWHPSLAEKGLIPNIRDVHYVLNQRFSQKYCDMYALKPFCCFLGNTLHHACLLQS